MVVLDVKEDGKIQMDVTVNLRITVRNAGGHNITVNCTPMNATTGGSISIGDSEGTETTKGAGNQWLKWRGTQGTPSPHLKYMAECVPPRQISQRTNGDGNRNA